MTTMVRPPKPPESKTDQAPPITEDGTSPRADGTGVIMNGEGEEEPPMSPQLGVDETALVTMNDSLTGSGGHRNSAILVDGGDFPVCNDIIAIEGHMLHSYMYIPHLQDSEGAIASKLHDSTPPILSRVIIPLVQQV